MTSSYRLGFNEKNWTVERRYVHGDRSRTPGKVEWRTMSYHGDDLETAALSLHGLRTRENAAQVGLGIGQLIEALEEARRSVVEEVWKVTAERSASE